MNKSFWIIMVVFIVGILAPSGSQGRGPSDVRKTKHNLSSTLPGSGITRVYYSSNEDEICVFCHTPHGGSLTGPLWNRPDTGITYTHYSSGTASAYLRGLDDTRVVSKESMLCLSCHDGSLSMFSVVNPGNRNGMPESGTSSEKMEALFIWGAGVGPIIGSSQEAPPDTHGDLMDDHPISLDYNKLLEAGGGKPTEFHLVTDAEAKGVRFFPGADGAKMLECSSCHDPHVDYITEADYTPFLIMKNDGSKLCLACHKK